jgi:hypothetical protein
MEPNKEKRDSKYSRKRQLRLNSLDELNLVKGILEREGNHSLNKLSLVASTSHKGEVVKIDHPKELIINLPTTLASSEILTHRPMSINENQKKRSHAKSEVAKKRPRDARGHFVPKDKLEAYGYTQDYEKIPGFDETTSPDYVESTKKGKSNDNRKTLRTSKNKGLAKKKVVVNKKRTSKDTTKQGEIFEAKDKTPTKTPKANKTTGKVKAKKVASVDNDENFEVAEATKVYITTNYDLFKLEVSNRDIIDTKVIKLMKDIKEKNLLEAFPIVVKSDMRIMDGQHRFSAAKRLGLPIYYIINDEFELNDIGKVNSSSTSWTLTQFLNHFVALGYEEYQKVNNFIQEHNVPLYSAVSMLVGRISHPNQQLVDEFKSGRYRIKNLEHAMMVIKQRNDYIERSDYAKEFGSQKNFISAVAKFTTLDEYDHNMMCDKLRMQPKELRKVNTTDKYLEEFVDIYNHHTPKKKRLSKERVMDL